MTDEWVKMFRSGSDQWFGICRPPELGSSALENTARKMSSGVTPSAMLYAVSR